jgi:hypothetical protein
MADDSFVSPLIRCSDKAKADAGKEEVRRMNGANGMSDIEGKAAQGSSERMEPPGSARHRWENRQVEWAGAHESMWATNEFQLRSKNDVSAPN